MNSPTVEVPTKESLAPAPEKASLFVLSFIKNNHIDKKNFFHTGTLRAAIDRGKRHCDAVGTRFLRVDPFVSDLEADEIYHSARV